VRGAPSCGERGLLPVWVTVDDFEPTASLRRFLEELNPYGVILFARHLKSEGQVRELTGSIREACNFPVRIGVDQEGGRVNRLRAVGMEFPGAEVLGTDAAEVRRTAREMGIRLRSLGFDVNFAPVADLGPECENTGLEGRLYSHDPQSVVSCCRAFLEGLRESGIDGCLKHFPGLGGSVVDSHRDLPRIPGTLEEREIHLVPYRRLAGALPYVMVAHGAYDFLKGGPASSLDPGTYELLRRTGFRGISVTDDLCMGALSAAGPLHDRILTALHAGAGVALWVSSQAESLRAAEILRGDARCLVWSARIPYPDIGRAST